MLGSGHVYVGDRAGKDAHGLGKHELCKEFWSNSCVFGFLGGQDAPRPYRLTVAALNRNSGPAGFLLGSSEAAGLITDSEEVVQIGISTKCRASNSGS